MGMQCHFDISDIPAEIDVQFIFHRNSETWSVNIFFDQGSVVAGIASNLDKDAWFDAGYAENRQLEQIKLLIINHICFSCS